MTLDQWLKLHKRYERYSRPIFRKALRQSYQPLLDAIGVIDFNNYKALTELLVSEEPLFRAYLQVYTKIGLTQGNITGKEINSFEKEYVKNIFDSKFLSSIYEWIQTNLGQRITEVNNYTIELIQKLFETGLDRNYTITQMRIYLEKQLNSPKFTKERSIRIARTESTTAANHGSFEAAKESDLVLDKIWLSVMDDRTRGNPIEERRNPKSIADHWIMNGVAVGQFENFKMSDGTELNYPGDQKGTARQIINCRCGVNLVARLDENGFPIRKR